MLTLFLGLRIDNFYQQSVFHSGSISYLQSTFANIGYSFTFYFLFLFSRFLPRMITNFHALVISKITVLTILSMEFDQSQNKQLKKALRCSLERGN